MSPLDKTHSSNSMLTFTKFLVNNVKNTDKTGATISATSINHPTVAFIYNAKKIVNISANM